MVDDPSMLSSYGWRRFGATLSEVPGLDHPALMRLGSWQEKISTQSTGSNDQRSSMPYRYAGDKMAGQRAEKPAQVLVLAEGSSQATAAKSGL